MSSPPRTPPPHLVSDHGEAQLRPRARLIRALGEELISSEVVAVLELVRNCYDADATRVDIHFERPHLPAEARLLIRDNGHGMDREVLLGPWLEPATPHKAGAASDGVAGNRSPRGRRRLGSKGVGRFATQRLGDTLRLETSTAGSASSLVAEFDWKQLDRADLYLHELRIPWRQIQDNADDHHGTTLEITHLRDEWTPERFERLRLGLSRLLGPNNGDAPFEIFLNVDGDIQPVRPVIELLKPLYRVRGEVLVDGSCRALYTDLLGGEEEWLRKVQWPDVKQMVSGPFRFEICAWDLDRDAFQFYLRKTGQKINLRDFRHMIRDHSGISLYRDGFRILPYGEPDNDWLRLDRRRVNNPTLRLSNNQILGRIQLTADENPALSDQTNREGLVVNQAYEHLREVTLELLTWLEMRRFRARRELALTTGAEPGSFPPREEEKDVYLESLLTRIEAGGKDNHAFKELRYRLDDQKKAVNEHLYTYAGLAAAGQLTGLVFGQLKYPLRQAQTHIQGLKDELDDALDGVGDQAAAREIVASVAHIERCLGELELRMTQLQPLASARRGRRVFKVSLRDLLQGVTDALMSDLLAHNIELHHSESAPPERQTDPSVVQQVAAILLDNAMYWLAQPGSGKTRRIHVEINSEGFLIRDNGPGIPTEQLEQVFDPWFTTRKEEDAAGMGLALARELLRNVGARVVALPNPDGAALQVYL